MPETLRIGERGRQILQTLFENGPSSSATLRAVIEPPMNERKMNAAIRRLRDLGLVRNRHTSVRSFAGRYHELASGDGHRMILSQLLNTPLERFKTIPGGTEALEHWQECTVWAKRLHTLFPDAKVVRDFELAKNAALLERTRLTGAEGELLPDLLLCFPRIRADLDPLFVGIEIERTQKSRQRIGQKLRRFATQSALDTVLYLCPRPKLGQKIAQSFVVKKCAEVFRIEHFANNFLLIADSQRQNAHEIHALNPFGEAIALTEWIQFIRERRGIERRGFDGKTGARNSPS